LHKAELVNINQKLQTELTQYQRELEVLREELELSTGVLNTVNALVVVLDREGHISAATGCANRLLAIS